MHLQEVLTQMSTFQVAIYTEAIVQMPVIEA